MFGVIIPFIPIILIVAIILGVIVFGYVKAPPDVAYIISGIKRKPRVLLGRAGIKIPYLERKDNLIVKQVSIRYQGQRIYPDNGFYRC